MIVIGYAAHLRIYEPIGSLAEPERARWTAYVESPEVPSRPMQMAMEHDVAVRAVLGALPNLSFGAEVEHAYLRHHDGLTYVCPWRMELRAWEALEEFRSGLAEEIADAFVPAALAASAAIAADVWRGDHPDVRSGIRSCGWQVPITWFVLFDPDERRLVLGDRRVSAGATTGLDRALVYLTAMSRARRRVAKALHVVQRSIEGVATEMLEDLARWLEEFHPHSLVELDYGGLVHLIDDESLSNDASAQEVAEALELLSRGDGAGAGEAYERVSNRWRTVGSLEHAN